MALLSRPRKCRLDDRVENPLWREDDEPSHLTLQELFDRGIAKLHVANLYNRLTLEYCAILDAEHDAEGRLIKYRYAPILRDDYKRLKRAGYEEV